MPCRQVTVTAPSDGGNGDPGNGGGGEDPGNGGDGDGSGISRNMLLGGLALGGAALSSLRNKDK